MTRSMSGHAVSGRQRAGRVLSCLVAGAIMAVSAVAGAADVLDPALKARLDKMHEQRDKIFGDFAASMSACLNRPGEQQPAFRGCGNWVQSVQATWGLVAYSGLTKDSRYIPQVNAMLTGQKLRREWSQLQTEAASRFPYGRAWLLRLAVDHFRVFDSQLMVPIADWTAQDILERYRQKPPSAQGRGEQSDSFALLMTYIYLVERDNKPLSNFTSELILQNFLGHQEVCDMAKEGSDWQDAIPFCATWAVAVTRGLPVDQYKAWVEGFLPKPETIKPVTAVTSPKQENVNFLRAALFWRLYDRTSDQRWLKAYLDHMDAGLARAAWKKTDGSTDPVAAFGVLAVAPLYYLNQPVANSKSERS